MEKETKEIADKIYAVGFNNGQIEMKNKVLKTINRDWDLITIKRPMDLIMRILKTVNKIRLTSPQRTLNKTNMPEYTKDEEDIKYEAFIKDIADVINKHSRAPCSRLCRS